MATAVATHGRVLSIDVECVATSFTHEDRSPCSVAVVDDKCQIIFSSLIKPADKVVSDLYPLTGLRMKDLEKAPPLEEVLEKVHALLDRTTILVGQKPQSDIKWLKLEKGVHYAIAIDLSDWFKMYTARYHNMSFFSLAHEAWVLLNIDLNASNGHLASQDARASMQLYLKYKDNEKGLADARQRLQNTRPRMTPAKACSYNYEGVCLAAFFAQMCTCNRPSLAND